MADTAPLVAEYMELLTCAVNGPSIEERKTIDPPLASSLFFNRNCDNRTGAKKFTLKRFINLFLFINWNKILSEIPAA